MKTTKNPHMDKQEVLIEQVIDATIDKHSCSRLTSLTHLLKEFRQRRDTIDANLAKEKQS